MKLLLIIANLLIPVAVLVFATGFFPYKPFITGLASHDDLAEHGLTGSAPERQFDKIIFMVVDALRSDFVFSSGSGFTYTQKLIRSGEAIPFTAHAAPPTITMPKIKAITTGSIPSFLDVILNFAEADTSSSLATQDTWLAQIRAGLDRKGNGRLVMYGDDTWLKLFPGMFTRSEGTSSFFVSDFTEVDHNVTRHIPIEIEQRDWDAMIMHYLGLDHIGHKAGPLSPNMLPKQMEMDTIVMSIYEAMNDRPHLNNTLFVLCGDHGMTDSGNHGGSAAGETSPALVFLSPKLRPLSPGRKSPVSPRGAFNFYKKVDQSDLAPTISSLLGHAIPKNNLGVIIPEFLGLWKNPKDQMGLLLRNSLQILSIVKATFPSVDFDGQSDITDCSQTSSDSEALACKWKFAKAQMEKYHDSDVAVKASLTALYAFSKQAQEVMSSTASNYDLPRLVAGIVLSSASLILSAVTVSQTPRLLDLDTVVFGSVTALYGIMMFASSYVEEEQQFWYWITGGWLVYLRIRSIHRSRAKLSAIQYSSFGLFLLHRISHRWNQTGQKFTGSPDIVTGVLFHHPTWMWTLVLFTYVANALQITFSLAKYLHLGYIIGAIGSLILVIPSLAMKLAFIASDAPELLYLLQGDQVKALQDLPMLHIARGIFTTLAAFSSMAIITALTHKIPKIAFLHTMQSLSTLLLVTQTRTHNIPLFLFFTLQHKFLKSLNLSKSQITLNTLILAHTSFYALGNSNAISSVDLSNGYNGISGFNISAVAILIFISNWAGPIFWSVSGIVLLAGRATDKERGSFTNHSTLNTLFISGSTLAMMLACTILRTHLFIWTVFSPKYLYTMAWSLGYHFLVTLGLGGGLWSLSRRLD